MKKITKLLLAALICFVLVGCEKKPTNPNDVPIGTDIDPKELELQVSGDVKVLENFDEVIGNLTFESEIAGITDRYLNVMISGEREVTFRLNPGTDSEQSKKQEVNGIVKGVGVACEDETCNVYVLTDENKITLFMVDKSLTVTNQTFALTGIESFIALFTDLEGKGDNYQSTVIMKTTDGKYYTDYKFSTDTGLTVREIAKQ